MKEFNYSPLDGTVQPHERTSFRNKNYQTKLFLVLWWFILSLFVLSINMSSQHRHGQAVQWPLVSAISILLFIMIWLGYATVQIGTGVRKAKVKRFADQNKLRFYNNLKNPRYKASFFQQGRDRHVDEMLVVPDIANPYELGTYQFVTGLLQTRRVHRQSYIRFKLSRNLPNIILLNQHNGFFGLDTISKQSVQKDQLLHLEGDFDKYFKLYAPKQYGKDALYIFTPDVMAAFIDLAHDTHAEIVDDELYVYAPSVKNLSRKDQLQKMVALAEKLGTRIEHQADYYLDEKIDIRELNVVAEPGQRLNRRLNVLAVAAVLFPIAILIVRRLADGSAGTSGVAQVIAAAGFVVLLGLYFVWRYRSHS